MREPRLAIVVEPNGRRRSLIRSILRELGVRTVVVDALQGIASLLRFFRTHVVLLDLEGHDGAPDLLQSLAAAPQRPPAIVIGGRPELPVLADRLGLVVMPVEYERANLLAAFRSALALA